MLIIMLKHIISKYCQFRRMIERMTEVADAQKCQPCPYVRRSGRSDIKQILNHEHRQICIMVLYLI